MAKRYSPKLKFQVVLAYISHLNNRIENLRNWQVHQNVR